MDIKKLREDIDYLLIAKSFAEVGEMEHARAYAQKASKPKKDPDDTPKEKSPAKHTTPQLHALPEPLAG